MINQATVVVTVFLGILTFVVPRKYFLLPYIMAACFVPADQRIIVLDLDFTILRILVLVGILRLWLLGEVKSISWNMFDKLLFLWAGVGMAIYLMQWFDVRALIYKFGVLFDTIGVYWLFRQSIRSWSDIVFVVRSLAVCSLLLVPFVTFEWITGNNPFEVLGRVTTYVREGRYRCQAAFPHSIMLGLFWATLIPLFVGLSKQNRCRSLSWSSTVASIVIVMSTASSTPILALASILFFLVLFRYRKYGRQAVWGLCALIATLHIVMEAPVWHLISRLNVIGGSTGWHRYHLIDRAVKHFGEWAILGTRSTAHWGWHLGDITNQFVLEAVRGGLIALLLFVALLTIALRTACDHSLRVTSTTKQWFAWCLCVSILGHCVSFIGVSYFGQILMLLYLTFAIVALVYDISNRPTAEIIAPASYVPE